MFEIVPPGKKVGGDPLPEGFGSLSTKGVLTMHEADAAAAGIGKAAVLLADGGTLRIAIRAARDGEAGSAVSVAAVATGKAGGPVNRRRINLARAIKRIGLDGPAVAGRHKLHRHDEKPGVLLILNLMGEGKRERK